MAPKVKKEDSAEKIREALRDRLKDKCRVVGFAIRLYCKLATVDEVTNTFLNIITEGVKRDFNECMESQRPTEFQLYPLPRTLKIKEPDEYLRGAFDEFNEIVEPLIDKMSDDDLIYYALKFEI